MAQSYRTSALIDRCDSDTILRSMERICKTLNRDLFCTIQDCRTKSRDTRETKGQPRYGDCGGMCQSNASKSESMWRVRLEDDGCSAGDFGCGRWSSVVAGGEGCRLMTLDRGGFEKC